MPRKKSGSSFNRRIGQNIKHKREYAKLTQGELGNLVNYSEAHISHIECGLRPVSAEALLDFSKALGTDCNSLVAESGDGTAKTDQINEILCLLDSRPEFYLGVVKEFIISLDSLYGSINPQKEAERFDSGAVLV